MINIKLLCNWTDSLTITKSWNNMKPPNAKIHLVDDDTQPDYWVIINAPRPGDFFIPQNTIVFHMEPNTVDWYSWYKDLHLFKVFSHKDEYNNIEWHLSWSFNDFIQRPIPEKTKTFSTIVSNKYVDIGHRLRVDFLKELDKVFTIDIYGTDSNYKQYKGSLPPHCKDDGIFPYKYHFNAENNPIDNYFTEKFVDAILGECLCFYWGCPNLEKYFDPKAFIRLDLNDTFQTNLYKIQHAINNNLWEQRITYIRTEKQKILNQMNFFHRLYKTISNKSSI